MPVIVPLLMWTMCMKSGSGTGPTPINKLSLHMAGDSIQEKKSHMACDGYQERNFIWRVTICRNRSYIWRLMVLRMSYWLGQATSSPGLGTSRTSINNQSCNTCGIHSRQGVTAWCHNPSFHVNVTAKYHGPRQGSTLVVYLHQGSIPYYTTMCRQHVSWLATSDLQ